VDGKNSNLGSPNLQLDDVFAVFSRFSSGFVAESESFHVNTERKASVSTLVFGGSLDKCKHILSETEGVKNLVSTHI
jgi:hypothetical protein